MARRVRAVAASHRYRRGVGCVFQAAVDCRLKEGALSETEDESALRDVDRQIAADRQLEFFTKHAPNIAVAAVAVVIGVGGWQLWRGQQTVRAETAAQEYLAVLKTADASPQDGAAALAKFAEKAPKSLKILADMRRAAILVDSDRTGALAIYRAIVADGGAAKRLRDLARLRAAYLSIADGRDAVVKDLGPLVDDKSPLGAYAREMQAVAAYNARDFAAAETVFSGLANDPSTPQVIRLRAESLSPLAAAGKAGVNVDGHLNQTDIVKALGLDAKPASGPAPQAASNTPQAVSTAPQPAPKP